MKFLAALALGAFVFGSMSFAFPGDEWKAPETSKATKNPTKADKESISAGAEVWSKYCKSCHGKLGEGDGSKAAELRTELIDFTQKKFQSQTDGELFYKVVKGKDEMPASKKKNIEDEDVWNLVNFMRTFAKK